MSIYKNINTDKHPMYLLMKRIFLLLLKNSL